MNFFCVFFSSVTCRVLEEGCKGVNFPLIAKVRPAIMMLLKGCVGVNGYQVGEEVRPGFVAYLRNGGAQRFPVFVLGDVKCASCVLKFGETVMGGM